MVGKLFGRVILLAATTLVIPVSSWSADSGSAATLREIKKEIRDLAADRERAQEKIQALEKRVEQLESENAQIKATDAQIKTATVQTTQQVQTLQQSVEQGPGPEGMAKAFHDYLGSHSFTLTGSAGFDYVFDQQSSALANLPHQTQNSFFLDWEPMFLYRPNDWMLFEGVLAATFGSAGTGTDLSSAIFYLFPNDFVSIVGGLFDLPFGDWYEDQSPMWVNKIRQRAASLRGRAGGSTRRARPRNPQRITMGRRRPGPRLHGVCWARTRLQRQCSGRGVEFTDRDCVEANQRQGIRRTLPGLSFPARREPRAARAWSIQLRRQMAR